MNSELSPILHARFTLIHLGSGTRVALDKDVVIGRSQGKVRLAHDHALSSQHAQLGLDSDGIWVQDLGSTNGTFIGEKQLTPHRKYRLSADDSLRIGQQLFTLEQLGPIPESTKTATKPMVRRQISPEPIKVPTSKAKEFPKDLPIPRANLEDSPISILYFMTVFYFAVFLFQAWKNNFGFNIPIDQLQQRGGFANYLVTHGQWWRLFSATLLHADILHLAGNLASLWMVGPQTIRSYGRVPFFWLIALGGVGGSLARLIFDTNPFAITVGASGAIFALFGACTAHILFYRGKSKGIDYKSTLPWILSFVISNLGFGIKGVDAYAHIGGFIVGFILALAYLRVDKKVSHFAVPSSAIALFVLSVFVMPAGPSIFQVEAALQSGGISRFYQRYGDHIRSFSKIGQTQQMVDLESFRSQVALLSERLERLHPETASEIQIFKLLDQSLKDFRSHVDHYAMSYSNSDPKLLESSKEKLRLALVEVLQANELFDDEMKALREAGKAAPQIAPKSAPATNAVSASHLAQNPGRAPVSVDSAAVAKESLPPFLNLDKAEQLIKIAADFSGATDAKKIRQTFTRMHRREPTLNEFKKEVANNFRRLQTRIYAINSRDSDVRALQAQYARNLEGVIEALDLAQALGAQHPKVLQLQARGEKDLQALTLMYEDLASRYRMN